MPMVLYRQELITRLINQESHDKQFGDSSWKPGGKVWAYMAMPAGVFSILLPMEMVPRRGPDVLKLFGWTHSIKVVLWLIFEKLNRTASVLLHCTSVNRGLFS